MKNIFAITLYSQNWVNNFIKNRTPIECLIINMDRNMDKIGINSFFLESGLIQLSKITAQLTPDGAFLNNNKI